MIPVTGDLTGWQAWTEQQATAARQRHQQRLTRALAKPLQNIQERLLEPAAETLHGIPPTADHANDWDSEPARKRAVIQAALESARLKKAARAASGQHPQGDIQSNRPVSVGEPAKIDQPKNSLG
jgi:electron transport complex protein RnfB